MQTFKVISLDMFQTLVNIQGRRAEVWKPILKQNFSEDKSRELGSQLLSHYFAAATKAREAGSFISSKEIYSRGFQQVFLQHGMDYDCLQAVDNLFAQHRLSEMYADTEAFYSGFAGNIRSALSVIPMSLCFLTSTGVILSLYSLPKGISLIRMTVITGCSLRL